MTASFVSNSATLGELTDLQRVGVGIALSLAVACLVWGFSTHVGYGRIWFGWLGRKGQSIVLSAAGLLLFTWAVYVAQPAYDDALDAAAAQCRTWVQAQPNKHPGDCL